MRNILLAGLLMCLALSVSAADEFVAGQHYQLLTPAQPTTTGDKIEVVELFWYGCPHCYAFEPALREWLKHKPDYVEFVRMPAVFAHNWEVHARAYFAAQQLGVLEKIHPLLFDAIHKDNRKLFSEDELAAFFVEQGVTAADFHKAYNSFDTDTKARRAIAATREYGITGVPSIIINGKYRSSAQQAGRFEILLKLVEVLAAKEHNPGVGNNRRWPGGLRCSIEACAMIVSTPFKFARRLGNHPWPRTDRATRSSRFGRKMVNSTNGKYQAM